MTYHGLPWTAHAERVAPNWLFTTDNRAIKAWNQFDQFGACIADGWLFYRRGGKIAARYLNDDSDVPTGDDHP